MSEPATSGEVIYAYGPIAIVWRVLIVLGLVAGLGLMYLGVLQWAPWLIVLGVPLLGPALFFGLAVAVRVERFSDGSLLVTQLFGSRYLVRADLGAPRVRQFAEGDMGRFHAPRAWVPVKGSWPVYLDLLGRIPDRSAFVNTFRIQGDLVPRQ